MLMDYKIAIPSYNRFTTLRFKTIAFLNRHNIDLSKVYIFAHPFSFDEYLLLKDFYPKINIIESKGGIMNSRNYINEYFLEKTKVVEIDDDVEDLIDFTTNEPLKDLEAFIIESFDMCGNGIWGVCALSNPFFSNKKDKYGLQSIVATFCGYILNKNIKLTLDVMEDHERTIQYHHLGKNILKRSNVGIKTKYWKNAGGIQTEIDVLRRIQIQNWAATELKERYSNLLYLRTRKSGLIDIRFKRNI